MNDRRRRLSRLAAVLFLDGFRAAPGWMTAVTAMLIVGSVTATCYPLGYRLLVDGALEHHDADVVWGVVVVAGLLSIGWALLSIGAVEAMALSDRIAVYRIKELITLISGVPGLEHLERPDYLTEMERLTANRRQLASAPRQLLTNISNAARIIALLALLASVSWWLLLLPVCAVPPLVADRWAKRITKRAENDVSHQARLASMLFALSSDVGSAAEIRAYGLAEPIARQHAELAAAINRRSYREAVQVLAVQGAGWLLYACALMGAVAFVVVRAADGAMSLGTVLMAVSLIRRSRSQLSSAAQGSGALVSTLATADRLFWLRDHAAEQLATAGSAAPPSRLEQGIALRGVTFGYPGTDARVLHELDAELPAGATVAIVGENGSGKTTLVKLLLGMYQPTDGAILVDGAPLSSLDPAAWRQRCTAAFQDFSRLHMRAVESVGVADVDLMYDEPAAMGALERAGAGDLVEALPSGLATEVGNSFTGGHELSGGQWQKLALGRAMRRNNPLLVVLDEPTASLDAQAEHALFERYAAAAADAAAETGAITVLVSHRFATVSMADLILYVEDGRAIEAGSHETLLAAGGRYAELYELQARGYR